MGDTDDKSRKNHYGLEGRKRQIQANVWDLGMCFDKREKGNWLFHICAAPCKVPWFYLAGCCFPCCVAFYQRQLLLHDKMYEEYEFCQGKYGRFWCPSLAKKIPYCCLCIESFCCVGCAIGGNRVLMNERYQIADSITETIILLVAAILSFFGYFGAIIGCWVNGVLNGQQENELSDKEGGTGLIPYCRWKTKEGGDARNNCWDLNKCEPCCGEPCNVLDALKCFVWWCCPCCSMCTFAKFFASSLGKDCNIMEHCVPYLVAYLCNVFNPIPICNMIPCWLLTTGTRHNTRLSSGTGKDKHYFGDCMMGNCCFTAPCALCQELRSQPKESWDWVKQMQEKGFPETGSCSEFKLFSNCTGILD